MSILHRLYILFLSVIQFFAVIFTPAVPNRGWWPGKEAAPMTLANREETALADTIEYAYAVKNAAQGIYTDSVRSAYRMSNQNAVLTHRLTGKVKTATLASPDGAVYVADTFESFYVGADGSRRYFETSKATGRVNTIRLGEYYYDCHVRDLENDGFRVDKAFHLYGDRLFAQYSLYSSVPTTDLKEFGSEIRIPAIKVADLAIRDKDGVHDKPCADDSSVEYVAFDIRGVGVVGFIVPSDGSTQRLTVKKCGGDYVVTQYAAYTPGTGLNDNEENGGYDLNAVTFGFRIYTDDTHSFEGVERAAYEERNPLTVTVGENDANAAYIGYEALRGAYLIAMDGTDFNTAYQNPDLRFTVPLTVENGDGRKVYFRANGSNGCLEAAALLDDADTLLPVDVEVCKNFQGDGGEPFYSVKDYQYGDSFFPLATPTGESVTVKLLNLYQNWGNYPLKQLSSIEFHTSYYHLSTGTTESNCIAPYFVGSRDGWTLPDFRGRSGVMWSGQPQFNSVGILKFMTHQGLKDTQLSEFAGSEIASCGPIYADVTDWYTDEGGKYVYSLRHVEMPQTDENRTYYTLKVEFTGSVTYLNFRRDFDLFYFDGRFVNFNKTGWLNEAGEFASADVAVGDTPVYHTLGNDNPYFGFYSVTAETAHYLDESFGSDFALIVKNSRIVSHGKPLDVPFAFRENPTAPATSGSLTLDAKTLSFRKGDSIEIDMILLPWGTGRETDDANARAVREDSVLNPFAVTATTGAVVDDAFIPTVLAENGAAEFTLSGGRNNAAVTVKGFTSLKAPQITVKTEDGWAPYDIASVHGYDGYEIRVEADGTYSFSFVVPAADAPQTFRVTQ